LGKKFADLRKLRLQFSTGAADRMANYFFGRLSVYVEDSRSGSVLKRDIVQCMERALDDAVESQAEGSGS
jgi:hypothetical protein